MLQSLKIIPKISQIEREKKERNEKNNVAESTGIHLFRFLILDQMIVKRPHPIARISFQVR